MPNSDVTVIIASYNQRDHISKCLDSVLSQKTEFCYEVMVVDSSGDGTADLVEQKYPSVQVMRLQKRAYPGTARNTGLCDRITNAGFICGFLYAISSFIGLHLYAGNTSRSRAIFPNFACKT